MTAVHVDPVVISGMAIEAPGGIDTPAAFWNALADGRELISAFPVTVAGQWTSCCRCRTWMAGAAFPMPADSSPTQALSTPLSTASPSVRP